MGQFVILTGGGQGGSSSALQSAFLREEVAEFLATLLSNLITSPELELESVVQFVHTSILPTPPLF